MESRVHGSHSDRSTGRASQSERHDLLDRGNGRSCDPFYDEGPTSGNADALAGSATSQRPCNRVELIRTRKNHPDPKIFNPQKKMCGTMRADAQPVARSGDLTSDAASMAVRDATESPAGTGERIAAVGLLPKQAPEAAGQSVALSLSVRRESKFREDRPGSY